MLRLLGNVVDSVITRSGLPHAGVLMSSEHSLAHLTLAERTEVEERLRLLRPILDGTEKLLSVADTSGISRRTLKRWLAAYRLYGPAGLIPQRRANRGLYRVLSQEQRELIENAVHETPARSVKEIYSAVLAMGQQGSRKPPSYRTVALFIQRHYPKRTLKKRTPVASYDLKTPALYRTNGQAELSSPNELWHIGKGALDVDIINERAQAARVWLTLVMDMYSSMIAGYYLSLQRPNATSSALALYQAILPKTDDQWHICGLPKTLCMDDPGPSKIRAIERICADMQITLGLCSPTSPSKNKPFELFHSAVSDRFRNANSRAMSLARFQEEFHKFLMEQYHLQRAEKSDMTRLECWLGHHGAVRLPEDVTQFDSLLVSVAKLRRVHADGMHFQGARYVHPVLMEHIGEMVAIRYDPRDLSQICVYQNDVLLGYAIRFSAGLPESNMRQLRGKT